MLLKIAFEEKTCIYQTCKLFFMYCVIAIRYQSQTGQPISFGNQQHCYPQDHSESYLPPSPPPISPTDTRRCCRFISGDMKLLAALFGVSIPELADLKQKCSADHICALRLIEKWMQKNPLKSKTDLYQLLLEAEQYDAAKRLVVL